LCSRCLQKNFDNIEHSDHQIEESLQKFCQTELNDEPDAIDRIEAIETCTGYPAEVILKMQTSLTVIPSSWATMEKGLLRSLYFGGTTKKVLRKTNKPVIIIPLAGREKRYKWRPRLGYLAVG
jgi:nucleotide-binding universal stress UspA family protein